MDKTYISHNEQQTRNFGERIAKELPIGSNIAIQGNLGSGKTHLVQGMLKFFSIPYSETISPSYSLVHEWQQGAHRIMHIDAYRLSQNEMFTINDDLIDESCTVFVEWPEKLLLVQHVFTHMIHITTVSETTRHIHITSL